MPAPVYKAVLWVWQLAGFKLCVSVPRLVVSAVPLPLNPPGEEPFRPVISEAFAPIWHPPHAPPGKAFKSYTYPVPGTVHLKIRPVLHLPGSLQTFLAYSACLFFFWDIGCFSLCDCEGSKTAGLCVWPLGALAMQAVRVKKLSVLKKL